MFQLRISYVPMYIGNVPICISVAFAHILAFFKIIFAMDGKKISASSVPHVVVVDVLFPSAISVVLPSAT